MAYNNIITCVHCGGDQFRQRASAMAFVLRAPTRLPSRRAYIRIIIMVIIFYNILYLLYKVYNDQDLGATEP